MRYMRYMRYMHSTCNDHVVLGENGSTVSGTHACSPDRMEPRFWGHFWGIFEAGLTLPANGIVEITRITFPIFHWLIFLRGVSGKGKEAPVVQRRPALAFKGTPCFGMIRHRSCEYMGKQNGNQSGLVHWPL